MKDGICSKIMIVLKEILDRVCDKEEKDNEKWTKKLLTSATYLCVAPTYLCPKVTRTHLS
jgi:hypothetical protein